MYSIGHSIWTRITNVFVEFLKFVACIKTDIHYVEYVG